MLASAHCALIARSIEPLSVSCGATTPGNVFFYCINHIWPTRWSFYGTEQNKWTQWTIIAASSLKVLHCPWCDVVLFLLTKHCTSPQTRPSNNECCLQKERDRQSRIWESVADWTIRWAANILLRISGFCSARIQKWGVLKGSFVSDGSQSFYKYTLYTERGLWYKQ